MVGIIYAALLAMGQSDMKRLVAYTSIAHFGFIGIGIFAFTTQAGTGAVLYMVNHGLATGLLFLVVGMLVARGGSPADRRLRRRGQALPVLAGVFLLAGLASLALPGTDAVRQRVPGADRHVHRQQGRVAIVATARHHPGRAATCCGWSSAPCRARSTRLVDAAAMDATSRARRSSVGAADRAASLLSASTRKPVLDVINPPRIAVVDAAAGLIIVLERPTRRPLLDSSSRRVVAATERPRSGSR